MMVTQGRSDFVERLRRCLTSSGRHSVVRRVNRDASLYVYGEAGTSAFIIHSGWVKQLVPDRMGKEFIVDFHTRGAIVGESAFADGVRHDSAVAKSDCVVHVVQHDELLDMTREFDLTDAWTTFLGQRQQCHLEMLGHFVFLDSERRLAARLVSLGERSGPATGDAVPLYQRITHEELASMIGTTRSRVGQFLQRFADNGLISRTRGRIVVYPSRLRHYLGNHT
jgi:CRP/FNR family transcriptional regulator, cyclic AMP receptor protein